MFTEETVPSRKNVLTNKRISWNVLAGKNKLIANLNLKGGHVSRIPIHDPKRVTKLTMKSIKELEQGKRALEVPNRTEAGENIKEGK